MKRVPAILFLCLLEVPLFLGQATPVLAQRTVPDSAYCIVTPWDAIHQALVQPGPGGSSDNVTITIRNAAGGPIPGALVTIVLSACNGLCIDSPDGLSGTTNPSGQLVLNPRAGGCADCPVRIIANGMRIRTYNRVVSSDWDGTLADGIVSAPDSAFFYSVVGTSNPCADYDYNGTVGPPDVAIFASAYSAHLSNTQLCAAEPDPNHCTVQNWDLYRQALVGPGGSNTTDNLTIGVYDIHNTPVPNALVEIDLSGCSRLCIDTPTDGLRGSTNASGQLVLNPRVGGCENCPVTIRANGIVIRSYSKVRSPDWDGTWANGRVSSPDSAFFAYAYAAGNPCVDYDGDGRVNMQDLLIWSQFWSNRDHNTHICVGAPDPVRSSVPVRNNLVLVPGTSLPIDEISVTVRDRDRDPVANAAVQVDLSTCSNLCLDSPDGLSGTTDLSGHVVLNPRGGGCSTCTAAIRADGITLGTYPGVASPDWDGSWADGRISLADSAFFAQAYQVGDLCADYNGTGTVELADFNIWAQVWLVRPSNSRRCLLPPSGSRSVIDPWDTYHQAFVIPGSERSGDALTIVVRDHNGDPLPDSPVEIDLSSCSHLCTDTPVNGLNGTTDAFGRLALDPRVGGCSECAVQVKANGQIFRTYPRVVSPDWDGSWADGVVGIEDRDYFWSVLNSHSYSPCADYNGDSVVDNDDLIIHAAAWMHQNADTCGPNPVGIEGEPGALTFTKPGLRLPVNPVNALGGLEVLLQMPQPGRARVELYSASGARLVTLTDGEYRAGETPVVWKGREQTNASLTSGVYFLRLMTPFGSATQRLVVVK
jgi:hypothetical protein